MDQNMEIKEEPVWLDGTAGTSFPAEDGKDEIKIEESTVAQLVPCFKEENNLEINETVTVWLVPEYVPFIIHYYNSDSGFSKKNLPQEWGKPNLKTAGSIRYAEGKKAEDVFPKKRARTDKGAVITIDELGKTDIDNSPWTEMIRAEMKTESESVAKICVKSCATIASVLA
ncbi:uncharacterized protein [Anabrus simplex]|uniref:uncharacterized protein isoform X2 n=1 Tax=Anabrus simplex TaxID=316456 RepID=UPI0035A36D56